QDESPTLSTHEQPVPPAGRGARGGNREVPPTLGSPACPGGRLASERRHRNRQDESPTLSTHEQPVPPAGRGARGGNREVPPREVPPTLLGLLGQEPVGPAPQVAAEQERREDGRAAAQADGDRDARPRQLDQLQPGEEQDNG